jgi:hypothetical protein
VMYELYMYANCNNRGTCATSEKRFSHHLRIIKEGNYGETFPLQYRCSRVFKKSIPKTQDSLFQTKFFHGDLPGLGIACWRLLGHRSRLLGSWTLLVGYVSQDTSPSLFIFLPRPRLQHVFVVDQRCKPSRTLDT